MNGARVCVLDYTKAVFNVHVCLKHSSRHKQNKIERCDEKGSFFQNLVNFHIKVFFGNGENALLISFVKYT